MGAEISTTLGIRFAALAKKNGLPLLDAVPCLRQRKMNYNAVASIVQYGNRLRDFCGISASNTGWLLLALRYLKRWRWCCKQAKRR